MKTAVEMLNFVTEHKYGLQFDYTTKYFLALENYLKVNNDDVEFPFLAYCEGFEYFYEPSSLDNDFANFGFIKDKIIIILNVRSTKQNIFKIEIKDINYVHGDSIKHENYTIYRIVFNTINGYFILDFGDKENIRNNTLTGLIDFLKKLQNTNGNNLFIDNKYSQEIKNTNHQLDTSTKLSISDKSLAPYKELLGDNMFLSDDYLYGIKNINCQPNVVTKLSVSDEIKKYKHLLDDGLISQENFNAKKNQLLGL